MKKADTNGEFLGVSSCAITVILVTLYITEINLSLSLSQLVTLCIWVYMMRVTVTESKAKYKRNTITQVFICWVH